MEKEYDPYFDTIIDEGNYLSLDGVIYTGYVDPDTLEPEILEVNDVVASGVDVFEEVYPILRDESVRSAVGKLPNEYSSAIVEKYYGLGEPHQTQKQIGKVYGYSDATISQQLKATYWRIRSRRRGYEAIRDGLYEEWQE